MMVKIAQTARSELKEDQIKDLEMMTKLMDNWNGSMDMESVAATVYTFIFNDFQMSLFHAYNENKTDRLIFLEGYPQTEFLLSLIKSLATEGTNSKYLNLCKEAYPEYTGKNYCGYNMAMAFSNAKAFLE